MTIHSVALEHTIPLVFAFYLWILHEIITISVFSFFCSGGSRDLNRLLHLKDIFIRPELWVQHILKIGTAQNLITAVFLLLSYNCHHPVQNDDSIPHPPDGFAPHFMVSALNTEILGFIKAKIGCF